MMLIGYSLASYPSRFIKTKDDGYMVIVCYSSDATAHAVRKLSSNMKHEWQVDIEESRTPPGEKDWEERDDHINSLIESKNGSYLAVGATELKRTFVSTIAKKPL
jgi:hypothetical protein